MSRPEYAPDAEVVELARVLRPSRCMLARCQHCQQELPNLDDTHLPNWRWVRRHAADHPSWTIDEQAHTLTCPDCTAARSDQAAGAGSG